MGRVLTETGGRRRRGPRTGIDTDPPYSVGETRVSVRFNDLGDSTEIVLVHDLFPAAEAAEGHRQGWTSCLDRLEAMFAAD